MHLISHSKSPSSILALGSLSQDTEQELISQRRAIEQHGCDEAAARHRLQLALTELHAAEEGRAAAAMAEAELRGQMEGAAVRREEAGLELEVLLGRVASATAAAVAAEEQTASNAKELERLQRVGGRGYSWHTYLLLNLNGLTAEQHYDVHCDAPPSTISPPLRLCLSTPLRKLPRQRPSWQISRSRSAGSGRSMHGCSR